MSGIKSNRLHNVLTARTVVLERDFKKSVSRLSTINLQNDLLGKLRFFIKDASQKSGTQKYHPRWYGPTHERAPIGTCVWAHLMPQGLFQIKLL